MARLFVGLWPPPEVVDLLEQMGRPAVDGIRWSDPRQWHVTLRFLGDAELDDAAAALGAVDHPQVEAVMGPSTALLGRSVLMAPVSGLDDLAAEVVRATAGVGRPPEDRPFRGHLTLARSKGRSLRPFVGQPIAARWTVERIALVRSELAPGGARYDDVAEIDLR